MKRFFLLVFALGVFCMGCAEASAKNYSKASFQEVTSEAEVVQTNDSIVLKENTQQAIEGTTANQDDPPPSMIVAEREVDVTPSKEATIRDDVVPTDYSAPKTTTNVPSQQVASVRTDTLVTGVVAQAKTGCEDEAIIPIDSMPVASEKADAEVAMRVAKEYAIAKYGINIDTSLNLDNSAYRFPAVVPTTVSQDTLNAKAIDMVEYTFQQLMRVDKLTLQDFTDLGFRCNVFTYESNGEFLTYVFYDA